MKNLRILALACALTVISVSGAMAEGFAVYEWSARGVALGGATMARTPDPSALASNPAAITRVPGTQVQVGLSAIMPYGKIKFDDSAIQPASRQHESDEIKKDNWFMPSMYFTYQVDKRLSVGIAEYTRFGLGFEYDKDWVGAANIYEVNLTTASVTPVMSYKITDKFSVGAGVEVMYLDITLKKKKPLGSGVNAYFDIEGDNVAYGGLVGLHYQFNDQWAAGVVYRHFVRHNVEGDADISISPSSMTPFVPPYLTDQDVSATVTLPESVSFAVSYTPVKQFSVEAGAIWTRWSRFENLDLNFEYIGHQPNKKDWANAWRFNIGLEYMPTDWLALRAGYVWDGCPVEERYEDYLIPTDGRNIYSLGVGFNFGSFTIDTAYAFVDPHERTYSSRPADGVYSSETYSSGTHIASVSLGYKF